MMSRLLSALIRIFAQSIAEFCVSPLTPRTNLSMIGHRTSPRPAPHPKPTAASGGYRRIVITALAARSTGLLGRARDDNLRR